MEEKLSSKGHTDSLLGGMSSFHGTKREVLQTDFSACIMEASHHNSTSLASQIAFEMSWMKLWDMALDQGRHGTISLQALYWELTRPQFK